MSDQCPRCKTTKYRNPNLKLLVNICGHSVCQECVDLLFARGSGNCPTCQTVLRRNNFKFQLFDNPLVERELEIRRKYSKDFNLNEEDFTNLNEYNSYLELREFIVYNLANGIDVDDTKEQLHKFKKQYKELIRRNRTRQSNELQELDEIIASEQESSKNLKETLSQEARLAAESKLEHKENLIKSLVSSDAPADQIVRSLKQESQSLFSSGVRQSSLSDVEAYQQFTKTSQPTAYQYEAPLIDICGPPVPDWDEIEAKQGTRTALVILKSLSGSGHRIVACRPKTFEGKFEAIRYDPWVRQKVLYREEKKIRSLKERERKHIKFPRYFFQ